MVVNVRERQCYVCHKVFTDVREIVIISIEQGMYRHKTCTPTDSTSNEGGSKMATESAVMEKEEVKKEVKKEVTKAVGKGEKKAVVKKEKVERFTRLHSLAQVMKNDKKLSAEDAISRADKLYTTKTKKASDLGATARAHQTIVAVFRAFNINL